MTTVRLLRGVALKLAMFRELQTPSKDGLTRSLHGVAARCGLRVRGSLFCRPVSCDALLQKVASAAGALANGTSPSKTPAATKSRSRLAAATKSPAATPRVTRAAAKTPAAK